jgi:hypothetical protein
MPNNDGADKAIAGLNSKDPKGCPPLFLFYGRGFLW